MVVWQLHHLLFLKILLNLSTHNKLIHHTLVHLASPKHVLIAHYVTNDRHLLMEPINQLLILHQQPLSA